MQSTCVFAKQIPVIFPLALAVALGGIQSQAQTSAANAAPVSTTAAADQPVEMPEVTVFGQLDKAREEIVPSLGATVYTQDLHDIQSFAQGDNIPISKLALRFPGVSQDSAVNGNFHVRDEHANVQYRINDVLIPEGITSFGTQFGTRFADSVDLITGALPAQYGFRQSGVLNITTKNGAFNPGGDVEIYGGSHDTIQPSFEYGGADGKLNYYFSGSALQNSLGIENPTSSTKAIHDDTEQYRGFAYLSYTIDDTSRLSLIAGEANNRFQIPNTPGQSPATDASGAPYVIPGVSSFNSVNLNESQREQNNFEVLAYQKTIDDFKFQLALFNSYSAVKFAPDWRGDLFFNGEAGSLSRSVLSNGLQFDSSYEINDTHTLRGGLLFQAQGAKQDAETTVIPLDADGNQLPGIAGNPQTFASSGYGTAYSYGLYLQDEWKITPKLTINYGGRFDIYDSSQITESQLSPRINAVYKISDDTTVHGGYARYFTPPPLENVPQGTINQLKGTTGQATPGLPNDPVASERAHYFDLGIVHKFLPGYQVGLDGYYKVASDLLDDGQFGAAPIMSAFNYSRGQICGLELSQNYTAHGLSIYANVAIEQGIGKEVNSAQAVLFSADDYAYIKNHYIYLDHSQTFTGSFGVSYNLACTETKPYVEMIVGSGLREDTDTVPNGASVPAYQSINVGFTQGFKWAHMPNLTFRFDIINVGDQVYEIRSGSGVGVFAPQYGQRRSYYAGLSYAF